MIPGTNIPARDRQRSSTPSGQSSVNTLLSKLRIEQQRHQVNLARKRYVGNDNSTERLPPLLGIGPTTQATTSPFQDIPDYTAPLPYSVSYTRSTRRATPGPKAPASWCPGAAPDTASTFDTRQGLSGFEDKWDCYALWLEYVLPKFLSGHLLPRPPRTRKFTQGSEVQVTESNGAQSLLQTSLAVLAGQLRPPDQGVDVELAYWITSDEVKHLMGCDWRIAIMVQGVLRYSPSWRSLRNLCLGSLHQDDPGHAITDEEADWEDGATTSDWGSEEDVAEHVPQLPILDLSFVTIPPPRSPSSRLFLSLFTSEASVRGLTALSLAASNLSFGEAMGYIPIAGANKTFGLRLRHLNLAGIRSTSVEELKRGLNKLRRVGDTLEFLDLSGCSTFSNFGLDMILETLLKADEAGRQPLASLKVLGMRYILNASEHGDHTSLDASHSGTLSHSASFKSLSSRQAIVNRQMTSLRRGAGWINIIIT